MPIKPNSYDTFIRVLAADLDADGLIDLIVTGGGDDYTLFFRNNPAAPGTFLAPIQLIPDHGTPIAIADFNHDGLPDVAYVQGNGIYTNPSSITVALNRPSAPSTFVLNVNTPSFSGYDVVRLIAADMNGDGFPDLVLECMPSSNSNTFEFLVFLNDSTHPGQFLAPTVYTPSTAFYSMAVEDLNHDGLPDVVVAGLASSFTVYLGDPAHPGQLLTPQNTAAPGNLVGVYAPAVGDIDGDGIPDVLLSYGNQVSIFAGRGDGTFLAPTTLLAGVTAPAWQEYKAIVTDLDGDGLNDLVAVEYDQNSAQISFCTILRSLRPPYRPPPISPSAPPSLTLPQAFRSRSPSPKRPPAASPPALSISSTSSVSHPIRSSLLCRLWAIPPHSPQPPSQSAITRSSPSSTATPSTLPVNPQGSFYKFSRARQQPSRSQPRPIPARSDRPSP